MPRPTVPWRMNDFLGLTDDVPVEARSPQASVLRNLYRQRGKLFCRKGTTPMGSHAVGVAQDPDGLFWARLDAADVLYGWHAGSVYDWLNPVSPTLLANGASRLTSGVPISMAHVGGQVIAGDGLLPNIRLAWNRADQVLPDTPATAPTTADGGAGSLSSGTYQWKVTFVGESGFETDASAASTPLVLSASRRASLTNIPVAPAGQDGASRKLYRTSDGGTTYRLAATIADNVTTSYIDNTADLTGQATLVTGNTRFPPCRILVLHDGRLMGADCRTADGDRRTVYISNFDDPAFSPASPNLDDPNQGTRIELSGPTAGIITGLGSHGERLVVFTADASFVLTGDNPIDYRLPPFANTGCVAHRTICSHRNTLFWLAADGVYAAPEGVAMTRISDDVSRFIEGLTPTQMEEAAAVCWDEKYFLVTEAGVRWFDTRYGMWGEVTPWPFRQCASGSLGSNKAERLFGSRRDAGRVWELETGEDDDGEPITCSLVTGDLDLGNPGREKRLHYVGATFKTGALGTATVDLYTGTGDEPIETFSHDLTDVLANGATVSRFDERPGDLARDEFFRIGVSTVGVPDLEILALDGKWSLAT